MTAIRGDSTVIVSSTELRRVYENGAWKQTATWIQGCWSFLFFGSVMASLAGTTLLWKGTVLDRIWLLNSAAYKQLLQ